MSEVFDMNSPSNKKKSLKTYPVLSTFPQDKKDIASKASEEKIIHQAFKYHSQGNISDAARYYQYYINNGFIDYRVFSNYGILLKDMGRLKEAEEYICKAIKLKPEYADSYTNLATILRELGRLKEAKLSQAKAIRLKPDCAISYNNLGNILKDLGEFYEAEISTRKAIDIKPDYALAHFNLGSLLKDIGRFKESLVSTNKAIELKPNYSDAYSNLGTIFVELGNLKDAETSYSKAIALKPAFSRALMNRWQLYFDKKEFNSALKDADSCNTRNSRACALETLYALGRIEEIYERIEKTSELDDENIRLAAFSSFISKVYEKNTSHNFCSNPLDFLYVSNLKTYFKDYEKFIRELINDLHNIKTVWNPANKATYNGFQTPIGINLFLNSSKRISKLKLIILNELEIYYRKFQLQSCSYIKKWPSIKNLFGWHVILKKQGYQSAHIHPSGWLSGVIYLKVVPSLNKDEGAIELSLNGQNYFDTKAPKSIHRPEFGDIVLFPSSLHHRTIPFTTDTDRIVIAFDLFPEGINSYGVDQ